MKAGNNLDPIFKEFLTLLTEEKVEFALVGGHAVAYHGYPRYTGDMDILIRPSAGNTEKVVRVLERFGMGSHGVTAGDLQSESAVLQLGYPPLRIDLITSLDGVSTDAVLSGTVDDSHYGVTIPIISRSLLIQNKKATGRTQDLLDVEKLTQDT